MLVVVFLSFSRSNASVVSNDRPVVSIPTSLEPRPCPSTVPRSEMSSLPVPTKETLSSYKHSLNHYFLYN